MMFSDSDCLSSDRHNNDVAVHQKPAVDFTYSSSYEVCFDCISFKYIAILFKSCSNFNDSLSDGLPLVLKAKNPATSYFKSRNIMSAFVASKMAVSV